MDQHLVTLLELVRVEGIVKMLWDNIDHDELTQTVHQVLQNENDNIRAELDRMTRYQLIRIADHPNDWRCTRIQASVFEKIVYGVFNSIRRGHNNAYINLDVAEIWSKTSKWWIPSHISECPVCGEHTYLHCRHCHSADIQINKSGQLFCKSCGEVLDRCLCDEGHEFIIQNAYDTLRLLPTGETWSLVSSVITDTLLLPFENTFQITANRVEIYPLHRPSLVNIADVPELKQVLEIEVSEAEYDQLHAELSKIKEKCRVSISDNCNKCTLSSKRQCLMKLFTTYQSYRPSPHNGDEFADVSFPVTIDNHTIKLVGVIKSALANNANLTRSSLPAREMLQQIFLMTQDPRVGLIAAICPSRFQDQFQEDLYYLSRLTNKPIVIFDDLYMCRQLKAFKEERKFA